MIRNITNTTRVKCVYAYTLASFILLPTLGHSLSLGRIVTNSISGAPFDADIAIDDVAGDLKPSQIKIKLASDQEYSDLGLEIEPYQKDLNFTPYKKNNSEWYIKVKSSAPLNKQFVNFLIAVDYPSGHTVREYMAILQNTQNANHDVDTTASQWFNSDYSLATTKDNQKIVRMVDNPAANSAAAVKPVDEKPLITYKSDDEEATTTEVKASSAAKVKDSSIDLQNKAEVATTQSIKPESAKPETAKAEALNSEAIKATDTQTSKASASKASQPEKSEAVNTVKQLTENKQAEAQASKSKAKITMTNIIVAQNGDSLWNIAKRYADNPQDITKMVDAIYSSNQHAFAKQNINMLKPRAKLLIPELNGLNSRAVSAGKISRNKPQQDAVQNAATASVSDSNIISIYSADGDLSKLLVKAAPATQTTAKPAAPKTAKAVKTSPTQELLNITSLAEDLARSKKLVADHDKSAKEVEAQQLATSVKPAQQKLKILSTNDLPTAPASNKLMLVSEQLVSRQKENQDLKEQVLILQSQLKDMRKLIDLRKQQVAGSQGVGNSNILGSNATVANNKVAAGNTVLDVFNSKIGSSKMSNTAPASTESKLMFWLMFVAAFGSLCLSLAYYYWRKYYKMQPITRDFMSEAHATETKTRNTKAYSDLELDEITVKAHSKVNMSDVSANFDLARAYIELDDYATAKRILDEVLQYGDNEHKKEAYKILESLPA